MFGPPRPSRRPREARGWWAGGQRQEGDKEPAPPLPNCMASGEDFASVSLSVKRGLAGMRLGGEHG